MHHHLAYALAVSIIVLPACRGMDLEPYIVTPDPYAFAPTLGTEDPPLELEAIVRGAARAKFLLLDRERTYVVLRRREGRRFVDVVVRSTPDAIEVHHLQSRGFRRATGRIHPRYYALLDELAIGIRVEQYASSVARSHYVPVEMQASTTRAEVTSAGTVTTTRAARLSTFVPPGETRYSVSAEGPPTAGAETTYANPFAGDE